MVMAFGGFLGLVGVPLPGVEIGIAASAILLGGMVRRKHAALGLAAAMVASFAVFHGHAHGTELSAARAVSPTASASFIATGCLHATGSVSCDPPLGWGRIALRAAARRSAPPECSSCGERSREKASPVDECSRSAAVMVRRAHAHLMTTGLGPVYDGISTSS